MQQPAQNYSIVHHEPERCAPQHFNRFPPPPQWFIMFCHLWFFIAGPYANFINTPCQVCSVTMVQGRMVVPGKKNERGRLQLCIRGVNEKTCLEETWKPRSWSGLRRHWDHILKTAAWDDAKKTSYWWKKYDTDFNYFFFNSSWWMIAGGRIYSNQIRTTKTQHS